MKYIQNLLYKLLSRKESKFPFTLPPLTGADLLWIQVILAAFKIILRLKNALMFINLSFQFIKSIYKGKNVALIICSCGFCDSDGNHLRTDHHQSRNLEKTREQGRDRDAPGLFQLQGQSSEVPVEEGTFQCSNGCQFYHCPFYLLTFFFIHYSFW